MTSFADRQFGDNRDTPARPTACPSCGSKAVGTLAKTITVGTMWRCQSCGGTWKAAKPPDLRRGNSGA
jgi:ribosomal protein L37AE/L43A